MGRPVGRALARDLGESDPQDIVRIATFNYVHVVVAAGFESAPDLVDAVPDDLVIYFREMQAANLRRNAAIRAQMREVGAVLAAEGVCGVVLKGGAELLDPVFPNPAFRFLSDLDILVPEPDIARVFARLRRDGAFVAEGSDISEIDSRAHHHLPPLGGPGWPVPLELHRWLGQGAYRDLLDPGTVAATAQPSASAGLFVPSSAYRLAHLVQHAQLQPPRFRDRDFSLRDTVEMEVMRRKFAPQDVATARRLLDAEGRAAWDALEATCTLLFDGSEAVADLSPEARGWGERAIAGFGRPGQRRAGMLGRWAGWYAKELLSNPERRRHYLSQLRKPGSLRRLLFEQRDRWRRTR